MSIKAISWALKQDIKGPKKAVLIVIANRSNKQGECWPSHSTIAFDSGCSITTAQRALEALKKLKLLKWESRFNKDGKSSNIYTVQLPLVSVRATGTPRSERPIEPKVETSTISKRRFKLKPKGFHNCSNP